MHNELQLSCISLPAGSIDAYIQRVNRIPLLSLEEERNFAALVQNEGDLEAARILVLSHLRYVVRVARGYLGYGLPLSDLIQEGNIGLMKAVKRFNPNIGVRLVSFAVHWIKSEIHEFVIQNWRIVKLATTKAQRKLFFNLRNMKKRLGWSSNSEVEEIAKTLGVKREDVWEMERRLNAMDEPYDSTSIGDDEKSYKPLPADYLHDSSYNPERIAEQENLESDQHERLHTALACLDDRSQDILRKRWLSDDPSVTLHTLASRYGVSAERIRQLEKNAMNKLREAMS
ncbi:MAG: RNA polymerase factor sigma-32 [Legionellales bacterium RIFCSPHIGHO2_12_FULL_35_11]|nr:MAG: RNA polymerase factor sigma-32 [Legionellales bacterium RIFCSPHIGHO2_12_FULL_35_11]